MANETKKVEQPAMSAEWAKRPDVNGNPGGFGSVAITFPRLGKVVEVDLIELSSEIRNMLMCHGLEQKLRDAGAKGTWTGSGKEQRRTTDADKFEAVRAVADRLLAGEWNAPRQPGEGGILYMAVNEAFPGKFKNAEALRDWIAAQATTRKSTKSAVAESLKNAPAVKAVFDRIMAERGGVVDSSDLVGEIDNLPEE